MREIILENLQQRECSIVGWKKHGQRWQRNLICSDLQRMNEWWGWFLRSYRNFQNFFLTIHKLVPCNFRCIGTTSILINHFIAEPHLSPDIKAHAPCQQKRARATFRGFLLLLRRCKPAKPPEKNKRKGMSLFCFLLPVGKSLPSFVTRRAFRHTKETIVEI